MTICPILLASKRGKKVWAFEHHFLIHRPRDRFSPVKIFHVNRLLFFTPRLPTHGSFCNHMNNWWIDERRSAVILNYRRWCPMRIASWSGRRRIRCLRGCRWLDLIAGRSRHSSRWKRRRNCWGFESGRREWADDGGSSNGRPSSGTCNCPARDSGNCTRSPWWWVSGWLRSAITRKT